MDSEMFSYFMELHRGLPRQAPGSVESSERALRCVPLHPRPAAEFIVADMGCGPGAHSVFLAQALGARVLCLDLLPQMLHEAKERAVARGCAQRVLPLQADMAFPPLPDGVCDLIWSEGSIYNIGFDHGLRQWAGLLRPGGALVVSELCWLESRPPKKAAVFWEENYPAMRTLEENRQAIRQAGFRCIDHFVVPERDWWTEYYSPLERRMEGFARRHEKSEKARAVLSLEREEIELRRCAGKSYGYCFFILQGEGRARQEVAAGGCGNIFSTNLVCDFAAGRIEES